MQILHLNIPQYKLDRVTNDDNSDVPDITFKNLDSTNDNSKSTIEAYVKLPNQNIEQPRYFTRAKKTSCGS